MIDTYRERTRSSGGSNNNTNYLYNLTTGTSTSNFYSAFTSEESCKDTVHPNWAERIANGEIINDSMEYAVLKTDFGIGRMYYKYYNVYDMLIEPSPEDRYGFQVIPTVQHDVDGMEADVKLGAIASIDATPAAMLEDVFEIKETLKFLRNPLNSLVDLSKSFSKSRKRLQKKRISRSKALANTWLQYRFAAMPLINSVGTIVSQIGIDYLPEVDIRRCHSYLRENDVEEDDYSKYSYSWHRRTASLTEAKATLNYTITNPVGGFRSQFGLRLKDVPLGLWNVVPLSFVVDRMVNISDAIAAGTNLADPNVHIRFGCVSRKLNNVQRSWLTDVRSYGISEVYLPITNEGYKKSYGYYKRVPWTPVVSDLVPRFKPHGLTNSFTKIVDSLALIIQNFS